MRFYVVALSDRPFRSTLLGRQYESIEVGTIYALGERLDSHPQPTEEVLRNQHTAVLEMGRVLDAILPVRFGALLEADALTSTLRDHQAVLIEALNDVRGRAQMTIRVIGSTAALPGARVQSGREYLERRRAAAFPPLSADEAALVARLASLAVRERRSPANGSTLATIYHLVNRDRVPEYLKAAADARGRATVSGPVPPFAFTPSVLA